LSNFLSASPSSFSPKKLPPTVQTTDAIFAIFADCSTATPTIAATDGIAIIAAVAAMFKISNPTNKLSLSFEKYSHRLVYPTVVLFIFTSDMYVCTVLKIADGSYVQYSISIPFS